MLSAPSNSINLSRTSGILDFQFVSDSDQTTTGIGPSIDDVSITGYKYGPVRSLNAVRSGSHVDLSWAAPYTSTANTVADTRPIAYRVWRADNATPSDWTELTGLNGVNRTALLTFEDTSPSHNASRYFVQAWDTGTGAGYGAGNPSADVVTVAADGQAPSAPGGPVASALSGSAVSLYWNAPTSGAAVTGYSVERATSSSGPFTTILSNTTSRYYSNWGLAAGTTYYYRIRAKAGAILSAPSAVVSARTLTTTSATAQQDVTGISYSGSWTTVSSSSFSGSSARRTTSSGAKVTIPFRGTSIGFYGTKGSTYGKVKIVLDGTTIYSGLSLYSSKTMYKVKLLSKSGLADKIHTLVITSTVGGKRVDIDSFTVGGRAPAINREQTTASFAGSWGTSTGSGYSGGSARYSALSSASMTLSFHGTGVTWLGTRSVARGKAKVYIDGALVATVDQFGAATTYQAIVWSKTGLSNKTHTLKIVPLAQRNPVATDNRIEVDALVLR